MDLYREICWTTTLLHSQFCAFPLLQGWTDNKFTWRIIPELKNNPDCGYVRGIRRRVIVIRYQRLTKICAAVFWTIIAKQKQLWHDGC